MGQGTGDLARVRHGALAPEGPEDAAQAVRAPNGGEGGNIDLHLTEVMGWGEEIHRQQHENIKRVRLIKAAGRRSTLFCYQNKALPFSLLVLCLRQNISVQCIIQGLRYITVVTIKE